MNAYVEILYADGTAERHELEGDKVIGRQPRSGIAIPQASELEAEHLMLSPRPDGCWLSPAEWASTPVVVNGQRVTGGLVPWGTYIQIGSVPLRVMMDAGAADAEVKPGAAVSTPTLLLVLVLIGAAAWLFLSGDEPQLAGMTSAPPPALFSEAAAACPEETASTALPRAHEVADAAAAKWERYPFAAQDGIEAVELYDVAASCYRVAGREGDADRLAERREQLAGRIEEDYRTHRLKLKRAIQYRRTGQALLETRELLGLVQHLDDPYTRWLQTMERHLSMRIK